MRRVISIMSLLAIGQATYAGTPTYAAKVAEAKMGMIADADEVFMDTFSEPDVPGGMTASQARSFSRWVTVGSYMGACKQFMTAPMKADWLTKLDQLYTGLDEGGDAGMRAALRQRGLKMFDRGDEGVFGELKDTQRKQLCSINLEASRQLLSELRF